MRLRFHIALFFLLGKSIFPALGQTKQECKKWLQESFHSLQSYTLPQGKNVSLFEYEVKTVFRNQPVASSTIKVKMIIGENYREVISPQMEMYQDSISLFTVIPLRKMIVWTDSDLKQKKAGKNDFIQAQESILKQSTLASCLRDPQGEAHQFVLIVEVNPEKHQALPIQKVTYQVDTLHKTIKKAILAYPLSSRIHYMEFKPLRMERQAKNRKVPTQLEHSFFTSDKKKVARYQQYQLVDNRTKKQLKP